MALQEIERRNSVDGDLDARSGLGPENDRP